MILFLGMFRWTGYGIEEVFHQGVVLNILLKHFLFSILYTYNDFYKVWQLLVFLSF